jgi:hypothetical protein
MKTISAMLTLNHVDKHFLLVEQMSDRNARAHYITALPQKEGTTIMAFMNRAVSKRGEVPPSKAIQGLPRVGYYPPLVATLAATLFVFLVVLALTVIAIGNTAASFDQSKASGDTDNGGGAFFCGALAIVGAVASIYFLLAVVKGVRDLVTPIHYTRGPLADKRVIGGRFVGNWIGVTRSYAGPDLETASAVTDEQAAASADRSRIVQTRNPPPARPSERRRGGYLSADRLSSTLVTDVKAGAAVPPGQRAIFRLDPSAYETLTPGEEVLVAHSRFLEHIYYIAHLRDGEWESFRNKALI